MKASSPIASSPIWPEAPALQAAQPSGLARTQPPSPERTVAGRSPVTPRPNRARTQRRGHPDREPGLKRANFGRGAGLPTLLLLPQLLILAFFFFIPSLRALMQSVLLSDPFGSNVQLVWFDNFKALFANGEYRQSIVTTIWFTVSQNVITLAVAVVLAFATDRVVRGRSVYRTLILLPYAIAPAIAGILWAFLFNPVVGPLAHMLHALGISWDPNRNPNDALWLVIMAASWKHICYDYIFLAVGLLAVPASLMEAAAVDGAASWQRFWHITLPNLRFMVVLATLLDAIYMFRQFDLAQVMTGGGPAGATEVLTTLVYKEGFQYFRNGYASAIGVMMFAVMLCFSLGYVRLVRTQESAR